jgi:hypothetical protein
VAELHRCFGLDARPDHRFLDERGAVPQATFSSGARITVDFGAHEVPPKDGNKRPAQSWYVEG